MLYFKHQKQFYTKTMRLSSDGSLDLLRNLFTLEDLS